MRERPRRAKEWNRRDFIRSGSAVAAASTLPGWFLKAKAGQAQSGSDKPSSPNDRPRIALVGCGGRGVGVTHWAADYGDIVAVCDVDANHLERGANEFPKARKYKDFRKLIDEDGVDVIVNGTPDHWHTLINIHAMRSGLDVYSEKPLTLTIDEGKKLVNVVRETDRILQTGSQQRSDDRFRLACELVRNGRIGKLHHITTLLPAGPRGEPFESQPVPDHLDWDFWLGSTPKIPYVPQKCHGSFRYWYQFSGGTMTDWGAHHNDIAQWGNGSDRTGPVKIDGRQLVEMIDGGYTAAAEYVVEYEYANGVRLTCRSVPKVGLGGSAEGEPGDLIHGVQFSGSDGWIFVTRGRIQASNPGLLEEPLPNNAERLYVSDDHMADFFQAIRSRKQPVCDAEIGHRSASVCHLGVISIRLGRQVQWDPDAEQFVDDAEANAMVARPMREPWGYEQA